MEKEFYRDEFEQFLKDTTDDFKMYPSRKVWHSIYNDLHPDRKWPSLAVCLLLLTAIMYLGVSNNNAINSGSKKTQYNYLSASSNESGTVQLKESFANSGSNASIKNREFLTASNGKVDISINTLAIAESNNSINVNSSPTSFKIEAGSDIQKVSSLIVNENATISAKIITAETNILGNEENAKESEDLVAKEYLQHIANGNSKNPESVYNKSQQAQPNDNREWIDNFALYNKKKERNSFKRGWSTQYYVVPSVGYRVLFKNEQLAASNDNSFISTNNNNDVKPSEPNEQGALSIEAGAGVIKEINSRFRIKTGLQFNYTDFITNAQKLDHPTTTTVAFNNDYGVSVQGYSSRYANTPGKNKDQLHNRTLQLSIPIGFDYKLLGNNKIAWYAGASFQPTYIAGGYAWVQSADNNFYVDDPSLLRRWNFNAGVESFVSIKTPSGASINLGPQFRYQLMSTYSKRYTYTEKPYSIGFKIGFSKPL